MSPWRILARDRTSLPMRFQPVLSGAGAAALSMLALAAQPAQGSSATRPSLPLAELISKVRAAHRTTLAPPATSFRGRVQVTPLAREQDTVAVKLEVLYEDDKQMIRYRLEEQGRQVERGRDRNGRLWGRDDKGSYSLGEAHYEQDRNELKKRIQLARQLLRFVDPGSLLAALEGPDPVLAEDLRQGRGEPLPCWTTSGVIKDMPIYHSAGERVRARVKVWVARETGIVCGLLLTPIDDQQRPAAESEFLHLRRHSDGEGPRLPNELVISRRDAAGRQTDPIEVRITELDLDPKLKPEDFDR
jgi:hypothetical protein